MLPAQIEHAFFVRAEAVQRFAVRPLEFKFGVIGLSIDDLANVARLDTDTVGG